jgi:hypothetical protein
MALRSAPDVELGDLVHGVALMTRRNAGLLDVVWRGGVPAVASMPM